MKLGLLNFATGGLENMNKLVENLFEYATHADELGFSRIWLGEHYYVNNTIWNNPEMLLPVIAGMTENIKIGTAGILLSYHNVYRVALNFKLLSNLFPGRIDLGLANGGVPLVVRNKLLPNAKKFPHEMPAFFRKKLQELVKMIREEEYNIFDGQTILPPYKGEIPSLWALGVNSSGDHALNYRMNFSKSIFHSSKMNIDEEAVKLVEFKERYFSKYKTYPEITIAFSGVCHTTSQKAKSIRSSMISEGGTVAYNEIIGCPNFFFDQLSELQSKFKVDEFIFLNKAQTYEDRILSLELLSKKFNLNNESSEVDSI